MGAVTVLACSGGAGSRLLAGTWSIVASTAGGGVVPVAPRMAGRAPGASSVTFDVVVGACVSFLGIDVRNF